MIGRFLGGLAQSRQITIIFGRALYRGGDFAFAFALITSPFGSKIRFISDL